MAQRLAASPQRSAWAKIWALAWLDTPENNLLEDLRRDPKSTIEELKKGANGKYQKLLNAIDGSSDITAAAQRIIEKADDREPYAGFLPIPFNPFLAVELKQENIENLLEAGLEGILKFDDKAEIWAKVLFKAWEDEEKFLEIRKDPVKGLQGILTEEEFRELQDSTYGLLPLPGRPKGFDPTNLALLGEFLDDQENADHIGGIFAVT